MRANAIYSRLAASHCVLPGRGITIWRTMVANLVFIEHSQDFWSYNKLLIHHACPVYTSEISDRRFSARISARSVRAKNLGFQVPSRGAFQRFWLDNSFRIINKVENESWIKSSLKAFHLYLYLLYNCKRAESHAGITAIWLATCVGRSPTPGTQLENIS